MPTITVRNVTEEVVDRLKGRAKAHNRSLEAEVRQILSQTAGQKSPEELLAIAGRIAAMTPDGAPQTDSTHIIREFRDGDR